MPVLCGLSPTQVSTLRTTFWLMNAGNCMRVVFQILTDSYSWAYPWMAASAWIEVTGLAIWAIDLWRAMSARPAPAGGCGEVPLALTSRSALQRAARVAPGANGAPDRLVRISGI